MILLGLGSNLPSPKHGGPQQVVEAALACLVHQGVELLAASPWYRTAPEPIADQPWFVNGVAAVRYDDAPERLLDRLNEIEVEFGRVRRERWGARILDLDLLAFGDVVQNWCNGKPQEPNRLVLPHPRLHRRLFVLQPMRDVMPGWRHPVLGQSVEQLIDAVPPGQRSRAITNGG